MLEKSLEELNAKFSASNIPDKFLAANAKEEVAKDTTPKQSHQQEIDESKLALSHNQTTEYTSVCQNVTTTKNECEYLNQNEKEETMLFPLQMVSGATGSGNDWIMWLAFTSSKFYFITKLILL